MRQLAAAILLLPALLSPALAYKHDDSLGEKLLGEFRAAITSRRTGADFYARLDARPESAGLRILLRRAPAGRVAWYDLAGNTVYFNTRHVQEFFDIKGYRDSRIIEILNVGKEARAEFVKRADALFLHELVHALQSCLYPRYRAGEADGNPVEFEYEAYFTEDLYFHEKLADSPELLADFLAGKEQDVYTSHSLAGYIELSLDADRYREYIRSRYLRDEALGYTELEESGRLARARAADERITAYATGDASDYEAEKAAAAAADAEKAAYDAFLEDFYTSRWPAFSAEALLLLGSAGLEAGNYKLALDCLAQAEEKLPPGEKTPAARELRTRGALAILQAAARVRDGGGKMPAGDLAVLLRSLEEASARTGRPFPADLIPVRRSAYLKALKSFSRRASSEKEPEKKAFYRENADYFLSALGGPAAAADSP
ncbi:MAG: hypothetical protein FD189_219 [Elusimicrobia bacterium]|nr:MAG: hypothetical protein FD154_371 [Elusimicrobiota bacterium]KAF0158227.1 MAG: hypothetical protein FD189_219 [Elusimicrobiota bacterium]